MATKTTTTKTKPAAKKVTLKTAAPKKPATARAKSAVVVGIDGKKKGTVTLPATVFGVKSNKTLIAQAVRVYLANQRQGGARTKTRGEVTGSGRKIYRQKGTGRARHGHRYAPIFVGGGVSHGPRARDFSRKMPQKAANKALAMSLSERQAQNEITFVDGMDKLKPKTKSFVTMLTKIGAETKQGKVQKSLLFVTNDYQKQVVMAGRNVENATITTAFQLTTYDVVKYRTIVMEKDSVKTLQERLIK